MSTGYADYVHHPWSESLTTRPERAIRIMGTHHGIDQMHGYLVSLKRYEGDRVREAQAAFTTAVAEADAARDAALERERTIVRNLTALFVLTDKNRLLGVFGRGAIGNAVHALLGVVMADVPPDVIEEVRDAAEAEVERYTAAVRAANPRLKLDPIQSSTG